MALFTLFTSNLIFLKFIKKIRQLPQSPVATRRRFLKLVSTLKRRRVSSGKLSVRYLHHYFEFQSSGLLR